MSVHLRRKPHPCRRPIGEIEWRTDLLKMELRVRNLLEFQSAGIEKAHSGRSVLISRWLEMMTATSKRICESEDVVLITRTDSFEAYEHRHRLRIGIEVIFLNTQGYQTNARNLFCSLGTDIHRYLPYYKTG